MKVDVARLITRSESPAVQALAKLAEASRERLPAGVDALCAFIAEADQQTLLELLAVLVASAIELRPGRADGVVEAICEAASLDMSKYWSATVESYFKDVIVDAIKELNPALDRSKLDKAPKKEVLTRVQRQHLAARTAERSERVARASRGDRSRITSTSRSEVRTLRRDCFASPRLCAVDAAADSSSLTQDVWRKHRLVSS